MSSERRTGHDGLAHGYSEILFSLKTKTKGNPAPCHNRWMELEEDTMLSKVSRTRQDRPTLGVLPCGT